MRKLHVDVFVAGAGPAGSAFALNLAPFQKVLMIEAQPQASLRIGESLPAAAGRLLADMCLYEDFLQEPHQPTHLHVSSWGDASLVEQDAMRNLDGHGWYLDRHRFDTWLQDVAQQRGAGLLKQTRLQSFQPAQDYPRHWDIQLDVQGKPLQVHAKMLIDASGRKSLLAKRQGIARKALDKLVCSWTVGRDHGHSQNHNAAASSLIIAEAGGWWYTSSLPGGGRMIAFYTDADLPEATACSQQAGLLQRAASNTQLSAHLQESGFTPGSHHGYCAAHSALLDQVAGPNWLAVGDAALSFDPLSSQGMFNALYTGLAAAEAVSHYDDAAQAAYVAELASIQNAYLNHLKVWYQQEQRWADQIFWQRRHST
ncbi:tryptophan 7-halogenase [Undibacterium sp. Ji50W]|uniref:tryptophan 7-halogenase n=1 Tax=Undibacterium sp. Ji50W TaxID=3413041 RepID=UPI003BF22A94